MWWHAMSDASLRSRSFDFLWLSLALLLILLVAFILPVVPNDYWWYLRLGQDITRSGAIPTVDALSYTRAGQPIVNHSWLSALIFWFTYQLGGLPLTFLLRGVFLGAAYALAWKLAREAGAGPKLAGSLMLVAALSGTNNWSFRPQMFAYLPFVFALWVLWRWQRGQDRWLRGLPLAALFWVNLHGSFVLLFALIGLAIIFGDGDRKKLMLWAGLALAATLLNPRLFGAWTYVLALLGDPSSQVYSAEWSPPINAGWQMNLFFAWLLLLPLAVAVSPRRPARMEWAWILLFGWMALTGTRYVIWCLFLLVPFTAVLLAEWSKRWLDRPMRAGVPAINYIFGTLILLATLVALPGLRDLWWRGPVIPLYRATPVAATAWLKAHPELSGPLWADLNASSYMVFALPERPVWIDTRFEVYPATQWEQYKSIENATPAWQTLLDRYGVNLLFLSPDGQPNLVAAVQASPVWCQQYRDEEAVIFSRCSKK